MSRETLAVPPILRHQVDERDRYVCRLCGIHVGERRVVHHIHYGGDEVGVGGRRKHHLKNLITLCDAYDNGCHQTVHADKHRWQPVLDWLVKDDSPLSVTGLQVRRWEADS